MGLGQMRTAVTLIRTVTEKDSEGFARKTDKTVAVFRAYREGRHGSVRWANLAAFSSATDLFRTRILPGITVSVGDTLLCGEERFEVTSVENIKGRGMYLEILAKKVSPAYG